MVAKNKTHLINSSDVTMIRQKLSVYISNFKWNIVDKVN